MEKLEPLSRARVRTVDHSPRGRVAIQPDVIVINPGDRKHALTIPQQSPAHRSLREFAGVPAGMEKSLSPDTMGRVLNDVLGKTQRYQVMIEGDNVVSFNKYEESGINAPPERVLRAVMAGIRGQVDFNRVLIEGYKVTLEVVGTNETPVQRGDLVRGGAMVEFSPIGIVRPSVQAFVIRLECTNGMTSNHALHVYNYHNGGGGGDSGGNAGGGDIWNWMRDSTKDAYKAVRQVAASYRKMIGESIAPRDRAMVLNNLIKQAQLGTQEAAAVQAMAVENPPQNSYDMMNLISWATSHVVENPRRIRRAQQVVANFTDETEHARVCPVCRNSGRIRRN